MELKGAALRGRERSQGKVGGASERFRVVVKGHDGSLKEVEFRNPDEAWSAFFTTWRRVRSGSRPAAYSVALQEHDGSTWRTRQQPDPNMRQIRARHEHMTREMDTMQARRARLEKLRRQIFPEPRGTK